MLVYLPAPTVSLRSSVAASAGPIAKFFHNRPDNAFQVSYYQNTGKFLENMNYCLILKFSVQVALAGTSYSFLQRLGAIVVGKYYFIFLYLISISIFLCRVKLFILCYYIYSVAKWGKAFCSWCQFVTGKLLFSL